MRLALSAPSRGLPAPARIMHAAGRKHSRKCALGGWAIATFSFSMICPPCPSHWITRAYRGQMCTGKRVIHVAGVRHAA